ncbi:JmjC domain-containing protein, partial [Streptomyces calidiresistens]
PQPPPANPVAELVLNAGDVLYLPRGWWHAVVADQGTHSLHLTCGLRHHTGAELITWLGQILRDSAHIRADLPIHGGPSEQVAHLELLRKNIIDALDSPGLLERYTAARDAEDPGRLRPSLPFVEGPPVDPELSVRLTSGRSRLSLTGDAAVFTAADHAYEFAPAAAPLLHRLLTGGPATVAELAATARLSVEQVTAVVGELVAGQAATISGHRP